MRCPICGSEYNGPHCPNCVTHLPAAREESRRQAQDAVDAEVIHDDDDQSGFRSGQWSSSSTQGFSWTSWRSEGSGGRAFSGGFQSLGGSAGMAFWITFGLMLACGFRFGVLAAIGFMVFYGIAAALGMLFTVNRLMSGFAVNPWFVRICNWTVCWLLTAWLAG